MKFLLIILFFLPVSIYSQDITGVWTGYIKTPGSQLEYELAISAADKNYSGYSLIIYPKDGIENIGIKAAKIKQGKKDIFFEDGELVYDNFTTQPRRVKMFGNLSLTMKDTLMILQGNFNTRSLDFRDTRTYFGEVYLQKTSRPLATKMLITMDELKLVHNLSFIRTKRIQPVKKPVIDNPKPEKTTTEVTTTPPTLKPGERKMQKVSEIAFSGDSLQLNFYDNGTIDGDTISVIVDGKIVAEKIKLTTKAFRVVIPSAIRADDSLLLVMHAESLGLIPPNTGLLIVQDGSNRHEIRFEGDMQMSSVVVLRKKR